MPKALQAPRGARHGALRAARSGEAGGAPMSPPDDETPAPPSGKVATLPGASDADNDTIPPSAPAIPRGEAQVHLSAALDELANAFARVESVGMALARALDTGPHR